MRIFKKYPITKQVAGNTNDGSVSRNFFSEYSKFLKITNICEDFIKR